jgi:uncharacterized protein (DUF697 family)
MATVKENVKEELKKEATTDKEKESTVLAESSEVKSILKNHVYLSAGMGLVPIPIVDMAGLTAIQIDMIYKLSKVYNLPFSKDRVKSIISALAGSIAPVMLTGSVASFLKIIPIVGSFAGPLAVGGTGAAFTYALGKVFIQHFETGGNILNFDPVKMQKYFKEQFEKGKQYASNLKKTA